MKKIVCLSSALLAVQAMYASYGSYGSSAKSLEVYAWIQFLVYLAIAIVNIMLFIKVWKMTNNVQLLTDKLAGSPKDLTTTDIDAEYRARQIVEGEDAAREYLRKSISASIEDTLKNSSALYNKDVVVDSLRKKYGIYLEKSGISEQKLDEILSERFPEELDGIKRGETIESKTSYGTVNYTCLGIDVVKRVCYVEDGWNKGEAYSIEEYLKLKQNLAE